MTSVKSYSYSLQQNQKQSWALSGLRISDEQDRRVGRKMKPSEVPLAVFFANCTYCALCTHSHMGICHNVCVGQRTIGESILSFHHG